MDRDGKAQREMEYWSPKVIVEMVAVSSTLAMEITRVQYLRWIGK